MSIYLVLWVLVFGLNIVPAFMPPTWMVLAFFHIKYDLDLIPLVFAGATAASLGRVVLYYLAKGALRNILPKKMAGNLEYLGNYLEKRQRFTIPFIIFYGFLPIPSNQAFITFGLADVPIKLIALAFFLARLVSYTFWVAAAHRLSDGLEGIFARHLGRTETFIVELVGFGIIIAISKINWKKVLGKKTN